MGISVLPITGTSTVNGVAYTVPLAGGRRYKTTNSFTSGIYEITTSPNTTQATVSFDTGSGAFPSTTTVGGVISYNLASDATAAYVTITTGTDIVVTINKVANALAGASISGTLDTITTSGTYNQTGRMFVLAIGGGGGGGCASTDYAGQGGSATNSRGTYFGYVNSATTVTIGAEGAGGIVGNTASGADGGTTNFGNLASSTGGTGGLGGFGNASSGGPGGGGAGGQAGNSGGVGNAISTSTPDINNGTYGGGGGGGNGNLNGGAGGGSGIGTGGTGGPGSGNRTGGTATGYASGGGGGGYGSANLRGNGGAGSPGVIYVLRDI